MYLLKYSLIIAYFTLFSCKKFLDKKPDKSLEVPSTLRDFQAILDDVGTMNLACPVLGEISSDEYYLTDDDFNALTDVNAINGYIWDKHVPAKDQGWYTTYRVVYNANIILDGVGKLRPDQNSLITWNEVKGSALFFRSFAFLSLAESFATPYTKETSDTALGIPLPLIPDPNQKIHRATLGQTYERIIKDAKAATSLLPNLAKYKTRPNKAAGYGLLARIYLDMQDYKNALLYSDSSIQLNDELMDFNQLDSTAHYPISRFNKEESFFTYTFPSQSLYPSRCKVDTNLLKAYSANDLRRVIFFKPNGNGSYSFKGSYSGSNDGDCFNGIATDEMYLIRAECLARSGKISEAISDLNSLLVKRWKIGTFIPYNASTIQEAIGLILAERRKELCFRGLRWADLRRLNLDPNYAMTLKRIVNGKTYSLSPNDLRYTFQIPPNVISFNHIRQNAR